MKRSEFLRKAILAAIAVPLGVSAIPEQRKVLSLDLSKGQYKPNAIFFKINSEILKDHETFEKVIKMHEVDLDRPIKSIQVGYEDDDFVKNLHTVIIHFV